MGPSLSEPLIACLSLKLLSMSREGGMPLNMIIFKRIFTFSFEATGFVNVLDVPSKPRLLKPDEVRVIHRIMRLGIRIDEKVRAEHVKLSWNPPEDDGGTPIIRYLLRYSIFHSDNLLHLS